MTTGDLRIPRPRQVLMQEILTPKGLPEGMPGPGKRRRRPLLSLFVVIVVLALGLGLLRLTGVIGGASASQRQAAELARTQAELRPRLDALMDVRATFFASERIYLPAMKKVRSSITAYNQKIGDVENAIDAVNAAHASGVAGLSYPAYPHTPNLAKQVKQLDTVAARMSVLHRRLSSVQPEAGLALPYSELLSAVDLLGQDARENSATLKEALRTPRRNDYSGGVSRIRTATLNGNSALPSVRRMNVSLVRALKDAKLRVRPYDLPGGTDLNPADHSQSVLTPGMSF